MHIPAYILSSSLSVGLHSFCVRQLLITLLVTVIWHTVISLPYLFSSPFNLEDSKVAVQVGDQLGQLIHKIFLLLIGMVKPEWI